jgi:type I restriction enzyme R subunit
MNEADTCRKYVLPKLIDDGWDNAPRCFNEQVTFTDGRIIISGKKIRRFKQKRADYLLRYTHDFPIAIIEAKADYKSPGDGLQQAKEYAEILGLKFAYSTNGKGIVEFDYLTGRENVLDAFPTPDDLWMRLAEKEGIDDITAKLLLTPSRNLPDKRTRYYQEIAINRTIQNVLQGKRRILIIMATGTGKTLVAFQICWKLWSARWNARREYRRPRILYLSDRNILVDDPKDKMFNSFGDARHKIQNGEIVKSRDIYFAIYQSLAEDERRPGLFREYAPDFFDLVIVDECHRGSAREDSAWREIIEYFKPAYQIGMTATPLQDNTRDTYSYFGNPIYTYSLRQGIDDGFLAPYRVHRVITTWDAAGWRPSPGDLDRFGREIPDGIYGTKEFERIVALLKRTGIIAKHLSDFLKRTDRFAKTMVFCVDQEHADEMRRSLVNENADLVRQFPDYVCRVTANEGDIGIGHLSRFQELETQSPVILTTSKLLTTGIDAQTCKNIVIARVVGSMTEFKQIIGRGTRVRDDYGKYFFNIIDYTGSSTQHFADPEFDGYPACITEEEIDEEGNVKKEDLLEEDTQGSDKTEIQEVTDPFIITDQDSTEPRKFYYDGGHVEIAAHLVYDLDPDGKQLRVISFTDYTAEKVRSLYPNAASLREAWADPNLREDIITKLEERGIDFKELAASTQNSEADPFDLLCHVAFNAPLRTRRERAERLQREKKDFFEQYGAEARAILDALLEKYAEHGVDQFKIPDVLELSPISEYGNVMEIAEKFGGAERLRMAFEELQSLLYAA